MKKVLLLLICSLLILTAGAQTAPNLASAKTFGLLSGSTISSADTTVVLGNAGASTSVSSYVKANTIYTGGATVSTAITDLGTAKTFCSGQTGTSISGTLAGQSLAGGVYTITGNATLYGALTLTGDTAAIYIFNISGNLLIDSALYYGIDSVKASNIFWNITGTTKINSYNALFGIVMSGGAITVNPFSHGGMSLLSQSGITINNDSTAKLRNYRTGARMYSQNEIYKNGNLKALGTCVGAQDACNMVINPSFEEIEEIPGMPGSLNCPQQLNQIHVACDWDSYYWLPVVPYTNHPSLFSDCDDYTWASTGDVGVPFNIVNDNAGVGQPAHNSGHNYAGIQYAHLTTYDPQDDLPPFSAATWWNDEKLEKYLPAPLVANKVYYMEFYSSLADKSNKTAQLGVYPATSQFFMGTPIPPLYYAGAPFFTTGTNVTANTSWNKYSGCVSTTRSDIDVISIKTYTAGGVWSATPSDPSLYTGVGAFGFHQMAYFYIDDLVLRPLADAGKDYAYNCSGVNYIGVEECAPIAGATYSWAPVGAFTIANAVIISPSSSISEISLTAAGTYTFELTVTLGGCSSTDQIVITNATAACTGATIIGPTTYIGTTSISAASVIIAGDIVVNSGNLTINSPNVSIFINKTITVKAGAYLTIDGAWLHGCSSCNTMWGGLRVEKGGFLIVKNGSLIEDAITAVTTLTTPAGSSIPDYQISQSIFNKNTNHIFVDANTGNMSTNTIKNSIFTCRTLPAPTAGAFIANFNTIKTALTTNTVASLAPYPTTVTRAGSRSKKGVEFLNVPCSPAIYSKVGNGTGGTADLNFFDNLDFGIYTTGSRLDIKNNRFQNFSGYQPVAGHGDPPIPPKGVAIYAPAQASVAANYVIIGVPGLATDINYFYDCFRAIEISNHWMVFIDDNIFTISSTPVIPPPGTNYIGGNGIYLKDIVEKIEIKNNDLTNWITAVWIMRNTVLGSLNPTVDVNGNDIIANASGYCNNAVLFNDITGNTITSIQPMYIRNNYIYDVKNGIKGTFIKNNLVVYNNGTITLRYTSAGAVAGIWLDGCDKAEVKNNTVNSLRIPYGSADNWDLRGIYVKASTNNKVFCNVLSYLGQCMVYEGNCLSTTNSSYGSTTNGILGNSMDKARTGLMLRLSGVIGQQGASTFPNSNNWNNAYTFTNGRTNAYSTTGPLYIVNTFSKLYCLNTTNYLPPAATNLYSGTSIAGDQYSTASAGLNLATGSLITCPTTYVPAGLVLNNSNLKSMDSVELAYAEELKQLLAAVSEDSVFSASSWTMQRFIYNELKEHTGLQEDSVLNAFYTINLTTSFGLFHVINDSIEAGNYAQAAIDNSNFTPANIIEENQQIFNAIYFRHLDSAAVYTAEDSASLYSIAGQCAIEGGDAVYQSRNLLMFIANQVLDFTDPCDANTGGDEEDRSMSQQDTREMKLYPNPGSGNLTLECNLNENETGILFIYDLNGRLIYKHLLTNGVKSAPIDVKKLIPSIYVYEIVVNDKVIKRDKLTIIK